MSEIKTDIGMGGLLEGIVKVIQEWTPNLKNIG